MDYAAAISGLSS